MKLKKLYARFRGVATASVPLCEHQLFGYGWWCTIWRAALTFFAAFLTGAALMFVVFVAFFDHKPGIDWMAVKFAVFLLIVYVLVLSIGFLIGWARNDKVLSMRKA